MMTKTTWQSSCSEQDRLFTVNELLTTSAADLYQKVKSSTHCSLSAHVITTEEVHGLFTEK